MSPKSPQKHVLSNNEKLGLEQAREKTLSRSLSKKTTQPAAAAAATTPSAPSKILTKPVAEKNLTPTYAEGSETAQYITSKFQGLSVSKPGEHHSSSTTAATTHKPSSLTIRASRTPPAKMPSQTGQSTPRSSSTPTPSPPASAPPIASNTSPTSQIWDKGVSVKEYLMNKFEPGEDEKALSKVISEAMSPRRNPGDVGVIEKVREAVTSLLRTEEPTKPEETNTTITTHTPSQVSASTTTTRAPSQVSASTSTTRAPSQVSASTSTTRAPSQASASTSTTRAPSQVSASTSTTRTPSQVSASTSTTRAPSQVSASTSTTRAPSQVSVSTSTTRAPSRIPVSFNAQEGNLLIGFVQSDFSSYKLFLSLQKPMFHLIILNMQQFRKKTMAGFFRKIEILMKCLLHFCVCIQFLFSHVVYVPDYEAEKIVSLIFVKF
jgi:hypothetical protein